MRYAKTAKEFPKFDLSTLPSVPESWVETSWHNDACPSFAACFDDVSGAGVFIYIDFANPADREFSDTERFTVVRTNPKTGNHVGQGFHTSNWDDVLRYAEEMVADFNADAAEHVRDLIDTARSRGLPTHDLEAELQSLED